MKKMISAISLIGLLALTSCAHHGKKCEGSCKKESKCCEKKPCKDGECKKGHGQRQEKTDEKRKKETRSIRLKAP